jgi:Tol biopolymer transport system component
VSDPFDAVLSDFDSAVPPRAAFAAGLRERLLTELGQSKSRRYRPTRALVIGLAFVLIVAGVATATYLAVRHDTTRPKPGSLTVIEVPGNQVSTVREVLSGGGTRVVWECPTKKFCGELTSFAWSPDGKLAAFTLDEIGGASLYIGLHILDLTTGRDLHLPGSPSPKNFLEREQRAVGCLFPTHVAWSPDSRRLAYSCVTRTDQHALSRIFTIGADGTGPTMVRTGLHASGWPSWSPDGKRLALAGPDGIYTIALDGSARRLIARNGTAPSWSPDGHTIAYESPRSVRLVTPAGVDVTPRPSFAPKGLPEWSPDGTMLAVGTARGTYLLDADGGHLRRVTPLDGRTPAFGSGRPAWYPGEGGTPRQPACASCL